MIIYTRHVKPYGFKANTIWSDAKSAMSYYIVEPKHNRVTGIMNFSGGNTLFRFNLTPTQFKQYQAGKLILVPPGCCCPTAGKTPTMYNCKILSDFDVPNFKALRTLLELHGYVSKKDANE